MQYTVRPSFYVYPTPLGCITIASNQNAITHIAFGACKFPGLEAANKLTNLAANELQEYLAGKRKEFSFPMYYSGTDFQEAVWAEVAKIPYGQTRSYTDIAQAVGRPGAMRAVGMANNRNPLPLVIPCHRVIGATGKPLGYAGGIKIKEFLLELERSHVPSLS